MAEKNSLRRPACALVLFHSVRKSVDEATEHRAIT